MMSAGGNLILAAFPVAVVAAAAVELSFPAADAAVVEKNLLLLLLLTKHFQLLGSAVRCAQRRNMIDGGGTLEANT